VKIFDGKKEVIELDTNEGGDFKHTWTLFTLTVQLEQPDLINVFIFTDGI
jgi:hypothetical protein